jgi:hypothetical protein
VSSPNGNLSNRVAGMRLSTIHVTNHTMW